MPAVIDFAAVDVNDLTSGDPAQAAGMITAMTGGLNLEGEGSAAVVEEVVDISTMTDEERAVRSITQALYCSLAVILLLLLDQLSTNIHVYFLYLVTFNFYYFSKFLIFFVDIFSAIYIFTFTSSLCI